MNDRFASGEARIIEYLKGMAERPEKQTVDLDDLPHELRAIGAELADTAAKLERKNSELIEHAFCDPLTGLGNRGAYERAIELAWLERTPVTCAYIDIDSLKYCNDNFGHDEGNHYITTVCAALTAILGESESAFRVGGDEFIVLSRTATETELEQRLAACREKLIGQTSGAGARMIYSFSFGCSHADPSAGDTRRQMRLDADRKMYGHKLQHHIQQPRLSDAGALKIATTPVDERVFQALAMTDESRYLFVINLDTCESQWSLNAVRDFDLPSAHPHSPLSLWLSLVHPDDRENVAEEIGHIKDGSWHFHTMQYRVRDSSGTYVLCEVTGFRLDGTDTEPNIYTGSIINRSMAETTDPVTGLGNVRALATALGQARHYGYETGLIALKVEDLDKVNERFGFDAGDRVLAETAGCMVEISRAKARVFRAHGVTFVALFENVNCNEIATVEHELTHSLGSPVLFGKHSYMPTVRIATVHYNVIDSQPATVIAELGQRVKAADRVEGTTLD